MGQGHILSGPPAWVTPDPLLATFTPVNAPIPIDDLLMQAWANGDAELEAMADHIEDIGAAYIAAEPGTC